jgi:hypothetical protein
MKLSKIHNLKFLFPEIAGQWHPGKNGDLTPDQVTPRSHKKAWWKCEKGHEWTATVKNRTYGRGCPYCANKIVNEENNLLALDPELAKQWHPTKNGDLSPENVTQGSDKKAWWKCEKGHEWQTCISSRSSQRTGCPFCSGRRVSKEKNLLTLYPEVAKQWHPTKNGKLKPEQVTAKSSRRVWWLCEKGHEWQAYVSNRSNQGTGCPYCKGKKASKDYNLLVVNPGLSKEWHSTKNGNLTPADVRPMSDKRVWWICEQGHEWKAMVNKRNIGKGCPYCAGKKPTPTNNLETVNPGLSKEWHPTKNGHLTPRDFMPNSGKKAWWICQKGHEWKAQIRSRNQGNGCPICNYLNPNKKGVYKKGHIPKIFKGFYTPRLTKRGTYVITTLKEKKKRKKNGKIVNARKITSYARYLWGLEHIPEGWVIWHLDGDPLNNDISNLVCISRKEALRRMRDRRK